MSFTVKDSGERKEFAGGMVRDTTTGKTNWHRVADGPMLRRWAELLTAAERKYPDVAPGVPNWTLAAGLDEYERFRQSAFRHFMQWFYGDRDEDHGAAVFFNINGYEYVKAKMESERRAELSVEKAGSTLTLKCVRCGGTAVDLVKTVCLTCGEWSNIRKLESEGEQ